MHQLMAATLDKVFGRNQRDPNGRSRSTEQKTVPIWPMIILKTPKGWTGPKEVDGLKTEGFWRSHQVPFAELAAKPAHVKLLEEWMKSYRPEELFDENGALRPEIAGARPRRRAPHERQSACQWRHADALDLDLPDIADYAVEIGKPGERDAEATSVMGEFLRDVLTASAGATEFPRVRPRRDGFQPARARVRGHGPGLERRDASL